MHERDTITIPFGRRLNNCCPTTACSFQLLVNKNFPVIKARITTKIYRSGRASKLSPKNLQGPILLPFNIFTHQGILQLSTYQNVSKFFICYSQIELVPSLSMWREISTRELTLQI